MGRREARHSSVRRAFRGTVRLDVRRQAERVDSVGRRKSLQIASRSIRSSWNDLGARFDGIGGRRRSHVPLAVWLEPGKRQKQSLERESDSSEVETMKRGVESAWSGATDAV